MDHSASENALISRRVYPQGAVSKSGSWRAPRRVGLVCLLAVPLFLFVNRSEAIDTESDVWNTTVSLSVDNPLDPVSSKTFKNLASAKDAMLAATEDSAFLKKKSQTPSYYGRIVTTFEIPPEDVAEWSDWTYSEDPPGGQFGYGCGGASEQETATCLEDAISNNPCDANSAVPAGPWTLVEDFSTYQIEDRLYDFTLVSDASDPGEPACTSTTSETFNWGLTRQRFNNCPASPPWANGYLATDGLCYNDLTGTITDEEMLPGSVPEEDGECGTVGNPCNPGTGNKHERETDYAGPGLSFVRSYNSNNQMAVEAGLGDNWTHNYAMRLRIGSARPYMRIRADGQPELMHEMTSSKYVGEGSGAQLISSGTEWQLELRDGSRHRYDEDGQLLWLETPTGQRTNLTYGTDGLTSITGPFGHVITLTYSSGRVSGLTDPSSQSYTYSYDGNGMLSGVTYPDTTGRTYHYEDTALPWALTGITDENSSRYSTFAYDADGRATSTEHAGGYHKYTLVYNANATTTVTDAVGNVTTYEFASMASHGSAGRRRPTKLTRNGNDFTRTYTSGLYVPHRPDVVTDENGNQTKHTYDTTTYQRLSRVEAFGTSDARTTSYQYLNADRNLLTQVTSPSVSSGQNRTVVTAYDANQRPTSITVNGYTPGGTAVSRAITLGYNTAGQVTSIDGPLAGTGDTTTLDYYDCTTGSQCGQLESVTNALGHITNYNSYDANGRLTQMTDANGLATAYTYDLRGRVLTQVQTPPTGPTRTTSYTYDDVGQLETVTAPNGTILTYAYDAAQQLTSVTDNSGNKIEYGYDLNGNLTDEDIKDSSSTLKSTVDTTYDARDRIDTINSAGSISDLLFDALGNLTSETDPNTNATTHSYDPLNRVTETVDALTGSTDYYYDVNDQLIGVNAPNDATTIYSYDDLGNLLAMSSPDTGTTEYTYDAAGNRLTQTDANSVTTTYTYDNAYRLKTISYPDTTLNVTLTYDGGTNQKGRLTAMTDGSGSSTFSYDVYGNLTQEAKTVGGNTHTTSYVYDAANLVTQITYPSGRVVDYTRNVLGQVTQVDTTYNSVTTTVASSIGYEPFGPLNALTFGNGLVLSRTFDQQYRITAQTTSGGGITAQNLSFTLDAAGNIDAITDSVTTTLNQTFTQDVLHRITQDVGSYGTKDFTYDGVGNRLTRVFNDGSTTTTQTLTYEASLSPPDPTLFPQVGGSGGGGGTSCSGSSLCLAISESSVLPGGSITAELRNAPGGSTDWLGYSVAGSAASSYLSYTYTGSGVSSYDWTITAPSTLGDYVFRFYLNNSYTIEIESAAFTVTNTPGGGGGDIPYGGGSNRMATHDGNTMTIDSAGNTTADPAQSLTFTYGDHNRMATASVLGVQQASYTYNGQGQRIKKVESTGSLRTFVFHYGLNGELIGESVYDSLGNLVEERDYVWLDSLPLAQSERAFSGSTITSSSFVYIHGDQLNTPRLATDSSKTTVWRWDSDAFGEGQADMDPDADLTLVNIRLRFPGQYLDEETNLHYNYFRDYDPVLGRYVESDPIGLIGGLGTYGYVGAQPLVSFDPLGLAQCFYSISSHTLTCYSNDVANKDFMGPTQIETLGPEGVYSGVGQCRNNPSNTCVESSNEGPIVPGEYKMNEDLRPGNEDYWRLESIPRVSGFEYRTGQKRSGFMLHPGSISLGCITTNVRNQKAIEQYNRINQLLDNEKGANKLYVRP